ncbi:NTP transferase domain-containing protein [Patescibacteria group bacterium]|nr:NTP transferase domain-containing protein [Patescibacteria group bacterium]MBU1931773.1 NTP transferase domain-containing protein [Patescibacteria group bacterium]
MKGIVLAGGTGTRLYPLTHATSKHLLPIYDKPMIFYPIETLVKAGIDEILVVVGGPHAGHYVKVLKNGEDFGLKHLEYAYQEETGGISQAIALAEDFADNGPITVILGDNTTDANIKKEVQAFKAGATIFIKKVPDPERFGVPVFDSKDKSKIINIEEKPSKPQSSFAVTGVYIYDHHCFNYIRQLEPSGRGELEVTDLNNLYIKKGQMRWAELKGFWSDAGTFESLYYSTKYWAEKS